MKILVPVKRVPDYPIKVRVKADGGLEVLAMRLPGVVTSDRRLNEPRCVTLPSIMKAKKKPLETLTSEGLGVDVGTRLATLPVVEAAPELCCALA